MLYESAIKYMAIYMTAVDHGERYYGIPLHPPSHEKGNLPVPGRPTIWISVGQGPTALAVGAGGGCLDIFTLICPFSPFSLSSGDGPI